MNRFMKKLGILFGRERFRSELDEEMAFHVEQAAEEHVASGMSPEEARYAAKRQLGNATLVKERTHETVGFRFEGFGGDLRYALRQLKSNPAFTVVMLLTLALSIGANSAIFSVIDGVLLKTLPYPRQDRIVRMFLSSAQQIVCVDSGIHAGRCAALRLGRAGAAEWFRNHVGLFRGSGHPSEAGP